MLGGSLGPAPGITICSSAERLLVAPWGVGGLPGPPAKLLGVLEGAGEAGEPSNENENQRLEGYQDLNRSVHS